MGGTKTWPFTAVVKGTFAVAESKKDNTISFFFQRYKLYLIQIYDTLSTDCHLRLNKRCLIDNDNCFCIKCEKL